MKYIKNLVFILLPILIASCGGRNTTSTSTSNSVTSSSTTITTLPVNPTNIEVKFTAINDFHGAIETNVGLSKLSTYLKTRKNEGSILINSGDSYTGSFMSDYSRGSVISEVFKDIGFDASTIGNHEFDWGIAAIKQHEALLGDTFLGANIYQYPNSSQKADVGDLYKIKTLYPGTIYETKVGIIGVIGKDQLSSITSTNVKDYIFLDPSPIIKSLSTKLRDEEGCNIVVADYHHSLYEEEINEIVPYVDAVFMGHTHFNEKYFVDGVPFIQAEAYGKQASELTLIFNKNTGKVTCDTKATRNINLIPNDYEDDLFASTKIMSLKAETDPIGKAKVGSTSRFLDTGDLSRYYAKLAYEKATSLGYHVDGVMFNQARKSLRNGEFTYSDLFETNPFSNSLYILSVCEYTLSYQRDNSFGYNVSITSFNPSVRDKYYDILVYDYNGLHMDVNDKGEKYYDYFASAFTTYTKHSPILVSENNIKVDVFDLAIKHLKDKPEITTDEYSGEKFI